MNQISLESNSKIKGVFWNEEEDAALIKGVEKYGREWKNIAKYILPEKTKQHCRDHYVYTLLPRIKVAPWSKEEEALLRESVETNGKQWSLIAQKLPGRTPDQCLQRYNTNLAPKRLFPPWSEEEDQILIQGIAKYTNNWIHIAQTLSNRSSHACRSRAERLPLLSSKKRPQEEASEEASINTEVRPSKKQRLSNSLSENQVEKINAEFFASFNAQFNS